MGTQYLIIRRSGQSARLVPRRGRVQGPETKPRIILPSPFTQIKYCVPRTLNYNYYRSYDPAIGRYTQSDPIGLDGGTNTYEYVKGDPAARVDMLGLYQCTYSISHHRMICLADNTPHPNFESSRYVSGNNSLPRPVSGNYQNNPTMTNVPFFGPIPMGNYIIGQQLIPSSRRALIPSPFNNMYGRFAFQTHGCANPNTCSEGCIAATTNITRNRFNDLMQLEEGHNTLSVVP